ncbi:IS5/IS1182 family transposase, partial [Sinorhizobium saheli]
MRDLVNAALEALDGSFAALYAKRGRPSIAPERMLRAVLLQMLYSLRSERQLMERLE